MNQELLTFEQEISLGKRVMAKAVALEELNNTTDKKRIDELNSIIIDGTKARDILISSNVKLVTYIAKNYVGRGLDFEDINQWGLMGLLTAADKYNPDMGKRFSTYATYWIKEKIIGAIENEGRAIRLPKNLIQEIRNVFKAFAVLEEKYQREITHKEVADYLGITEFRLLELLDYNLSTTSLDKAVINGATDDDDITLGDIYPDNTGISPYKHFMNSELKTTLNKALELLDDRERYIVDNYFGLNDGKSKSFDTISSYVKLSRERVRQIFNGGIAKIQNSKYVNDLRNLVSC